MRARPILAALAGAALVALGAGPAAAIEPLGCDVTDATLTWGFKESFRAYIDGDIANGEWITDGAASYETPVFTWSGGTGTYVPLTGEGEVAFTGSVRFTGHGGVLDTTIANPVVRFDGARATLLLDVSGPTMEGDPVEVSGAEFVELDDLQVGGEDALVTVDAATTLTADGAAAFPNYPAGEVFDPLRIDLPVGDTCAAAVPDLPPAGGDDTSVDRSAEWVWIGAGVVALAAIAAVAVVLVRRVRGTGA